MKKLFFAFSSLLLCAAAVNAQQTTQTATIVEGHKVASTSLQSNDEAAVKFNETKHDFGNIAQGKPVTTVFTYTNTGSAPLVIETATASCGCTKPEYPKEPVLPGKTGEIKVTYNAAALGGFNKPVTVKFVGATKPTLLFIDGTVQNPASAKN